MPRNPDRNGNVPPDVRTYIRYANNAFCPREGGVLLGIDNIEKPSGLIIAHLDRDPETAYEQATHAIRSFIGSLLHTEPKPNFVRETVGFLTNGARPRLIVATQVPRNFPEGIAVIGLSTTSNGGTTYDVKAAKIGLREGKFATREVLGTKHKIMVPTGYSDPIGRGQATRRRHSRVDAYNV